MIGVTGGIGAGKSVVCQVFSHLDVPIYDADSRARSLMTDNEELIQEIKATFGEESYDGGSSLNRQYLAERVFSNEAERLKLNALVHPRVGEDFALWVKENKDYPYVIKEAALLIESGSVKELDRLIVVLAQPETRVRRVLMRDAHRSKAEVESIIEKQLSQSQFKKHADYVINNDEDQPILKELLKLHREFLGLASQRG